jgi:cyclopropane fatty-acyl-phospholipid synthase-like methyltransferase
MLRIPEPELMDAPAQARAYAEADFSESNQAFVDRFAELAQAHPGATGSLLDLGCGPGDICIRLARALPDQKVIGLDAGPNMLELARRAVARAGLIDRIELIQDQLPCPLPQGKLAAIVSNSLLHHLPDPMSLWTTLAEQAPPGCLIQIMDLHRPDSEARARALVSTYAADAPEVLATDFYNSLLAAYTKSEIAEQLRQSGLSQLRISLPSDRHWLVQGVVGDG